MNLDNYNNGVQQWAAEFTATAKATASGMGISHRTNSPSRGDSVSKIKGKVGLKDGAASRVSIRFPRSLIWTQKGAGKGRGGSKGSKWINKFGNSQGTRRESFGKMGTGGRTAKPFLNTALDGPAGVEKLGDIVAAEIGGAIVSNLFIK